MTGRLIAIVGPSGVGKDSVMEALAAAHPSLSLVTRVITRPSELGGEAYIPATEEEFETQRLDGAFVLNWPAHGLRYGIPKAIQSDLDAGRDLLVNLSRAVLPEAQKAFPSLVTFLVTASAATLRQRLSARGRETEQDIENRLKRASFPMPDGVDYITLSNDGSLDQTVQTSLSMLFPKDAQT